MRRYGTKLTLLPGPVQPNRGLTLWVGTPCYNSILETLLGTSNLSRLVTGHSALCQPGGDPSDRTSVFSSNSLFQPSPVNDPRHSGLTGDQRPVQPQFEGAALLHAINQGQQAAEDFLPLHEVHRTVMRAGCEVMGQHLLFSRTQCNQTAALRCG